MNDERNHGKRQSFRLKNLYQRRTRLAAHTERYSGRRYSRAGTANKRLYKEKKTETARRIIYGSRQAFQFILSVFDYAKIPKFTVPPFPLTF